MQSNEQAIQMGWSNAATLQVWDEVFSNFSTKGWERFCVGFCDGPDELAPDLKAWAQTYLKNLPIDEVAWEEIAENMIDTYHHG